MTPDKVTRSVKKARGSSSAKQHQAICTSCSRIMTSYEDLRLNPILEILQCKPCYHSYTLTMDLTKYRKGVDINGKDNYCRWCLDGGDLLLCSDDNCHNGFCEKCVDGNFGRGASETIKKSASWYCYVCDQSPLKDLQLEAQNAFKALRPPVIVKVPAPERLALQATPTRSAEQSTPVRLAPQQTPRHAPMQVEPLSLVSVPAQLASLATPTRPAEESTPVPSTLQQAPKQAASQLQQTLSSPKPGPGPVALGTQATPTRSAEQSTPVRLAPQQTPRHAPMQVEPLSPVSVPAQLASLATPTRPAEESTPVPSTLQQAPKQAASQLQQTLSSPKPGPGPVALGTQATPTRSAEQSTPVRLAPQQTPRHAPMQVEPLSPVSVPAQLASLATPTRPAEESTPVPSTLQQAPKQAASQLQQTLSSPKPGPGPVALGTQATPTRSAEQSTPVRLAPQQTPRHAPMQVEPLSPVSAPASLTSPPKDPLIGSAGQAKKFPTNFRIFSTSKLFPRIEDLPKPSPTKEDLQQFSGGDIQNSNEGDLEESHGGIIQSSEVEKSSEKDPRESSEKAEHFPKGDLIDLEKELYISDDDDSSSGPEDYIEALENFTNSHVTLMEVDEPPADGNSNCSEIVNWATRDARMLKKRLKVHLDALSDSFESFDERKFKSDPKSLASWLSNVESFLASGPLIADRCQHIYKFLSAAEE